MKLFIKQITLIIAIGSIAPYSIASTSSTSPDNSPRTTQTIKPIEWGISQMQGTRPTQEDRFVVDEKLGLYALLDGHGGENAVTLAAEKLPEVVKKYFKTKPSLVWPTVMSDLDNILLRTKVGKMFHKKPTTGGTTVIAAIIKDGIATIANVGDSRAILIRDGNVLAYTTDFKPNYLEEKQRIEAAGGTVIGNRLIALNEDPSLEMGVSRALGDFQFKSPASGPSNWISSEPEVAEWPLENGDMIILACDDLWDQNTNSQVSNIVMSELAGITKNPDLYFDLKLQNESRITEFGRMYGQRMEQGNSNIVGIARALRNKGNSEENVTVMVIQYNRSN